MKQTARPAHYFGCDVEKTKNSCRFCSAIPAARSTHFIINTRSLSCEVESTEPEVQASQPVYFVYKRTVVLGATVIYYGM